MRYIAHESCMSHDRRIFVWVSVWTAQLKVVEKQWSQEGSGGMHLVFESGLCYHLIVRRASIHKVFSGQNFRQLRPFLQKRYTTSTLNHTVLRKGSSTQTTSMAGPDLKAWMVRTFVVPWEQATPMDFRRRNLSWKFWKVFIQDFSISITHKSSEIQLTQYVLSQHWQWLSIVQPNKLP